MIDGFDDVLKNRDFDIALYEERMKIVEAEQKKRDPLLNKSKELKTEDVGRVKIKREIRKKHQELHNKEMENVMRFKTKGEPAKKTAGRGILLPVLNNDEKEKEERRLKNELARLKGCFSNLDYKLWAAISSDCPYEDVEILLSAGANPNIRNSTKSLFELACEKHNMKILHLLLDCNLNLVEEKPRVLSEVLQCEIVIHNNELAKRLIDAGADIHSVIHNRTALDIASMANNVEIGEYLLDKGVRVSEGAELWVTIMDRHFEFAQMLVERGEKIDKYTIYWARTFAKISDVSYEFFKMFCKAYLKQKGKNIDCKNMTFEQLDRIFDLEDIFIPRVLTEGEQAILDEEIYLNNKF